MPLRRHVVPGLCASQVLGGGPSGAHCKRTAYSVCQTQHTTPGAHLLQRAMAQGQRRRNRLCGRRGRRHGGGGGSGQGGKLLRRRGTCAASGRVHHTFLFVLGVMRVSVCCHNGPWT